MFEFFSAVGGYIMAPLYYLTSAVLVGWHWLWSKIFDADSGAAWVLSIIGLTVLIRAALIPLFVKQIKSSRNMQLIQPQVKELQKKYGHDREKLTQETMALYKETGTNPFASCLPILVQMPIFLSLFRLLDHAADGQGRALLTDGLAQKLGNAELWSVPISATLFKSGGSTGVVITALVLVIAMTVTTFMTQRQLMAKNMPADALSGPYAQQQKVLLYVLPVAFAFGGIAFPIALLIYWTTSNLWTMGQQFWVIRNNPAVGTPAFAAKQERDRAKALRRGEPDPTLPVAAASSEGGADEVAPAPKRQQPKRQTREQRKKSRPGSSS